MTLEHATTSGAVQKRNHQETFDMELNYTVFNPQIICTCRMGKTPSGSKQNLKCFLSFQICKLPVKSQHYCTFTSTQQHHSICQSRMHVQLKVRSKLCIVVQYQIFVAFDPVGVILTVSCHTCTYIPEYYYHS
jgi:predicted CDP-diglyceride synthetase/phosphatidate cytidylyltransferase